MTHSEEIELKQVVTKIYQLPTIRINEIFEAMKQFIDRVYCVEEQASVGLTMEETRERNRLVELRGSGTRMMFQDEQDRLRDLTSKMYAAAGDPMVEQLSTSEYWRRRCLLAEEIMQPLPDEYEVTPAQLESQYTYNQFLHNYGKAV